MNESDSGVRKENRSPKDPGCYGLSQVAVLALKKGGERRRNIRKIPMGEDMSVFIQRRICH
jgi:hypothetical protein